LSNSSTIFALQFREIDEVEALGDGVEHGDDLAPDAVGPQRAIPEHVMVDRDAPCSPRARRRLKRSPLHIG
jgi:hypothetical protein